MRFDFADHFFQHQRQKFFDDKTYKDLADAASFFAELLRSEKKELIGIKMRSPFLSLAAQLACLAIGKTAVLISHLETDESIKTMATQVPFELVIQDEHFTGASVETLKWKELPLETSAVVVMSSGSSGPPKGILLSLGNLFYSARGFIEYFQIKESDVTLMNLPHHHVGGLMTLWRSFFSGSSLMSLPQVPFDIISVVPLQLARALENAEQTAKLAHCKVILVGGAKLTPELKEKAQAYGLRLYETYGMSESCSLVSVNGEVLPYRELVLDQEGTFLIGGKTLAQGYYREGSLRILPRQKDGRFKTNDKGTLTHGRFHFSHRADLVFISGGENINPLAIEDLLRTFPGIHDAYVLPVEDERWGEMAIALYDAKEDISETDLKNFLRENIHPHHIPKKFFRTSLMLKGMLKPKRNELKKTAEKLYLCDLFSHEYRECSDSSHEKTRGKAQANSLLVFFHGFTGNKDDLLPLGESFLERYSLLSIDLPGHGQTKADRFFSTRDMLDKLARFIRLFSPQPIFYGYSMGGRVALQLALTYLTPVHCILESSGPGLVSSEEARARLQKDLSLFDSFASIEEFLDFWYRQDLFHNYRSSPSFVFDMVKKSTHDMEEWKRSQKLLSQGQFPVALDTFNALSQAKFKLTYLYGGEDLKYREYASTYARIGKTYEIAGASHNPHKTHPEEITAILKTILK